MQIRCSNFCDEEASKATEMMEDFEAVIAKHPSRSRVISPRTGGVQIYHSGRRDLSSSIRAACLVKEAAADGHHACKLKRDLHEDQGRP